MTGQFLRADAEQSIFDWPTGPMALIGRTLDWPTAPTALIGRTLDWPTDPMALIGWTHPDIEKLTALAHPAIAFFRSSWPPSTDCKSS